MYVTLKMNIEDREIRLEANLTNRAGRIYREYFGRDLVDDMTDIYKKTHQNPFEGIDFSRVDFQGKTEEEVSAEILNLVAPKYLGSRITSPLSFEDTETGCHIVWAFIRNHKKSTPNYDEWIEDFDFVFPVADLVEKLYEAWTKTAMPTVELKN